ncbi:serpin peptidase inhibitor, clade A (alpha-1 antiproteinase, antitrypsin), member 10a isoform X1 [Syngnathoides biaculeatus]|uniref:serpin peptidase inhibitor, clade A (alpha-1 antiproteinase, antitrypsin), member 10a isoform X1 n=2 Tax=Syngnathoides biaculeatus TaxID=300417 RepID=UPI002ADDF825|nr:serpin peptidase inhibitor, clade A (alpha-1 antiproteinase, antitrypsin), member 10a isoform X1 [Syngnathoides biaculeatus]
MLLKMDGFVPHHSQTQISVAYKLKMGFVFLLMCLIAPVQQSPLPYTSVLNLSFKNVEFAMDLYRKISTYHDENIIFSPLSISTSFAALSMASDGATYKEIMKGLNLETLEQADQPDLIPNLFQMLHGNISHNGATKLDQAMSLFVRQHFSIEKTFEEQMKSYFYADINSVNFEDTNASISLINQYIKDKTRGKVEKMLSGLDPTTELMMINTFYFQGGWKMPFNRNYTYNAPFYVDNYNIRQVPMMFKEDKFETMEDTRLGARVLKLPYLEGVSMLILLPNKGVDYNTIDDEINAKRMHGWIKKLQKTKLEITIPKFKMEKSYSLHDILPELGFTSLFSGSANLTRLSKDKGLKVSEVLHKAVIDVDEVGTTAAAATTIGIVPYSLPRTFIVNRPFFFFIYHEETKSLLFMGRVIDPTKN